MSTNFRIDGIDFDDTFIRKSLFTQGGLWMWGRNSNGGLGDNSTTNRSSAVQITGGGPIWKQVATSNSSIANFSGGIKTDGTLWMWGYNLDGCLGDNSLTTRSSPVQTVSAGTNWKQLAVSAAHSAAIKTDGTLWLWGFNNSGQLGDGTVTRRSSPVQTISAGTNWSYVSAGSGQVTAIKSDGTLWLWGNNDNGELGDNSITHRSSPVQTVSGGNNWAQVSAGLNNVAAIKTDGSLWIWGDNFFGQLGSGNLTKQSSPVQTVSGGNNWKSVALGRYHAAAVKTDGTLWLWGSNITGQLGDNTRTHRSSPVQTVSGGTDWSTVSAGNLTVATKTDSTLWVWGNNNSGALGTGNITHRSSPVQTTAGGSNWKTAVAGFETAGGIRIDYY